jgi:zinc D-Ala-D-Ala carboxypeptidase
MRLTKSFYLNEFEKSSTALRLGIDNSIPPGTITENIELLAICVLQPIRDHFNLPVVINSGYRSPALNKAVQGSLTSQHCKGEAADIEIPGVSNYDLAIWIRDNLAFDQLILEFYTPGDPSSGWVHVSYTRDRLRNQALTIGRTVNKVGIHK